MVGMLDSTFKSSWSSSPSLGHCILPCDKKLNSWCFSPPKCINEYSQANLMLGWEVENLC